MTVAQDAGKEAREMIVAAIEDLRNAGIEVPLSLHRAAQALHHAKARTAPEISSPFE
jgi:hypothetical protein